MNILLALWIFIGTLNGVSYQVEAIPNNNKADTKRTVLTGENKGVYLIQTWEFDCKKRTVRNTHYKLFAPTDELIVEEDLMKPTLKVERNSLEDKALDIWCEKWQKN